MWRRSSSLLSSIGKRSVVFSSIRLCTNIPEPITKENPREKLRSLQYQKDLEDFQNENPNSEYVVIGKGSIFDDEKIRKMMDDDAITPEPKSTRQGSKEFPYLIRKEYNFIDKIRIKAISGKGGDGCLSFDRQPSKPRGPPNGGNGGDGGSVIIRASTSKNSLFGLQPHHFRAANGQSGKGSKRNGKAGSSAIVEVPPGTIIKRIKYFVEDQDDQFWGEANEGWQNLQEGTEIDVDEEMRQQGDDPDAFELPCDGEEFDGFENSQIRVEPMEPISFAEVAKVNAKSKGTQFVDQEDELDDDLDEEYVIDDSSELDTTDIDSDDDGKRDKEIMSSEELDSRIGNRLGDLLKHRKVTDEKQRNLTSEFVADLSEEGQEVIIAMGGKGAKGNQAYHWRASKVDGFVDKLRGGKSEEISLELEMKMLANVGLVGYPNAGKSTLLRTVSRATPKVASYPFTTLRPRVGMVDFSDYRQVSVADLPGIIEGAHQNRGLGFTFLRHIERTNVLCFVVSLSQLPGEPIKHFRSLLEELEHYKPGITTAKRSLLLANKIDIGEQAIRNFNDLKQFVEDNEGVLCPSMPVLPISAKENTDIVPALKKLYEYVYVNPSSQ